MGSPRRVALEALAASLRGSAAPAIGEAMRALASGRLARGLPRDPPPH
jgi:hypothetical protein